MHCQSCTLHCLNVADNADIQGESKVSTNFLFFIIGCHLYYSIQEVEFSKIPVFLLIYLGEND